MSNELPPAKRRRIMTTDDWPAPESFDDGSPLPLLPGFSHDRFRRLLACFILVSAPTKNPFRSEIGTWFEASDIRGDSVHEMVDRDPTDPVHARIDKLIKICLEGLPSLYPTVVLCGPRPTSRWPSIRRTYWSSSYRPRSSDRGALKGPYVVRRLIGRFKMTTSCASSEEGEEEVVPFSYCYILRTLVGLDSTSVDSILSRGKRYVLDALVELFQNGTMPHFRHEEEDRVLKDIDLQQLHFYLCGRDLPRELMAAVLSFIPYNYDNMFGSIALLGENFLALVLSTWPEVRVHRKNLFQIPNSVWTSLGSIKIGERTKLSLLNLEFKELFDTLAPLTRLYRVSLDDGDATRRFVRHWVGNRVVLLSLRVFEVKDDIGYFEDVQLKGGAKFRLHDVAPNLEVARNVLLLWCIGLEKLAELWVHPQTRRLSTKWAFWKRLRVLRIRNWIAAFASVLLPPEGRLECLTVTQVAGDRLIPLFKFLSSMPEDVGSRRLREFQILDGPSNSGLHIEMLGNSFPPLRVFSLPNGISFLFQMLVAQSFLNTGTLESLSLSSENLRLCLDPSHKALFETTILASDRIRRVEVHSKGSFSFLSRFGGENVQLSFGNVASGFRRRGRRLWKIEVIRVVTGLLRIVLRLRNLLALDVFLEKLDTEWISDPLTAVFGGKSSWEIETFPMGIWVVRKHRNE